MIKAVHKYLTIFVIRWQEALMYRAESLLWFFIDAMPLVAMMLLWAGVYRFGGKLLGFSLPQLLIYYFVGFVFSEIISTHFEENTVEQVIDGAITQYFVKPLSFFRFLLTGEFAWKILYCLTGLVPLIIVVAILFGRWFVGLSISQIICLSLYIFLGFILDSLLSFLIITGAFYFDQGKTLSHAKWIIVSIFNGSLLPLTVYPPWLRSVANILPFQYQFAIPTQIYSGTLSVIQGFRGLAFEFIWIIILGWFTAYCWRQAQQKFTAVGS